MTRRPPAEAPDRIWQAKGKRRARIVLVHGIGEHSGRYEHVGKAFAEHGFETLAFDLHGHGLTPGRRGDVARWDYFLDQIESRIDRRSRPGDLHELAAGSGSGDTLPVILYGHSMGGLIAVDYVLSERPSPDLLVLSAPALAGGARWQRSLAPVVARVMPRFSVARGIKPEGLSRDPEVGKRYLADPLMVPRSSARLGAGIFAAMRRARTGATHLPLPVLVIHGDADIVVPVSASECIGGDDATRRVYPGMRHEPHNEPESDQVLAEIAAWIEQRLY